MSVKSNLTDTDIYYIDFIFIFLPLTFLDIKIYIRNLPNTTSTLNAISPQLVILKSIFQYISPDEITEVQRFFCLSKVIKSIADLGGSHVQVWLSKIYALN